MAARWSGVHGHVLCSKVRIEGFVGRIGCGRCMNQTLKWADGKTSVQVGMMGVRWCRNTICMSGWCKWGENYGIIPWEVGGIGVVR